MTTEEKVLKIIKSFKGKLPSRQIAKELGISSGYADLLLQSLERRKIIKLSSGWISLFKAEAKESAKPQAIKRQMSRNKCARIFFSSTSKTSAAKSVKPGKPKKKIKGVKPFDRFDKLKAGKLSSSPSLRAEGRPKKPFDPSTRLRAHGRQETKSSLAKFKGITRNLEKILEKAGYKKVEDLARASLVRLMQDTGLKLKQAANLINETRKRFKIIK